MALLNPFSGTEALAKAPINQDLMDQKIRANLEDLASQIDSISAGGGGAGDTGYIAELKSGGETNEPRYWKRRFHPLQHMLHNDSENISGFDPEGVENQNVLLTFSQENDNGITTASNANLYLGQIVLVAKNSTFSFKIKSGTNFFSLGYSVAFNQSDNVEVLIDGQTPTSLNLKDENSNPAVDFINTSSATTYFQKTTFFYGLDGEEHLVTLKNLDSAIETFNFDFIEVGFRTTFPSKNRGIVIKSGKASVRGADVSFQETQLTFGKEKSNGHTGAIVIDGTGAVTHLDGESPAMTQAKPEDLIAFSGSVTSLNVKNNFYFPSSGICIGSTPYGEHHIFSYTTKNDSVVQSNSLSGITWQTKPTIDFTPLDGFTGTIGQGTGDFNINYWGTAPILIDSTNNKLDFSISIGGVTTTHVATIDSGRYSADLVPIEKAFKKAMSASKPINGTYNLKFSNNSQLWSIYVDGEEVESISLLFSSGLNSANSIHNTLGFSSTDHTGKNSYVSTIEKQHLSCRALEKDSVYMYSENPRIKYSNTQTAVAGTSTLFHDIYNRLGFSTARFMTTGASMIQIFVDDDCCGLAMDFLQYERSSVITVQVDDGKCVYMSQLDNTQSLPTAIRGRLQTGFISFPRGSRKITVRNETSVQFEVGGNADNQLHFAGCRQYFSKPSFEKLSKSQAIVKAFEISPISLYATVYGNNSGALYSPSGTDNINTITESGSWTAQSSNFWFNRGYRRTNVNGDYVDVNFTLVGDGGGVALKSAFNTTNTNKIGVFISQSPIVEATDRVQNNHGVWSSIHYDQEQVSILGLKAGTYTARFKQDGVGFLYNIGFVIIDTVEPEENKNTVSDVTTNGQSVSYAINVVRSVVQRDSQNIVPSWLDRSGYKEGLVSKTNYAINSPTITNPDDASALINEANRYFASIKDNVISNSFIFSGFCKSVNLLTGNFSTHDTSAQLFIDGVQDTSSFSLRSQVKAGLAPSSGRLSHSVLSKKVFSISCTHNSGLLYNVSDTRGFISNETVVLFDGTNKENVVIDSFVVGVSFTIKKTTSIVVNANVSSVGFQGFHSVKMVAGTSSNNDFSAFQYEPMDVTPSKSIIRMSSKSKLESVSVIHRAMSNGDDLYYPVHSDGVVGDWGTSSVEVIGANGAAFRIEQDLKNIVGTDIDIKITSTRMVPVIDESERF